MSSDYTDATEVRALAVREDPAPARVQILSLDQIRSMGQVFFESGLFKDVKSQAQAIVKIVAGQELGIPPMAAMTQIQIVEGKPTLTAPAIGARIKSSGRYDYAILEHTKDACEIRFTERGVELGISRFTMADAQAAGLAGKEVWKKYPRNMLFARAITNGARWYCADVFTGAIYTAEELGGGDLPPLAPAPKSEPKSPVPVAAVGPKTSALMERAAALGITDLKAWCAEEGVEYRQAAISAALDGLEAAAKRQADEKARREAQEAADAAFADVEPSDPENAPTAPETALFAGYVTPAEPEPPTTTGRLAQLAKEAARRGVVPYAPAGSPAHKAWMAAVSKRDAEIGEYLASEGDDEVPTTIDGRRHAFAARILGDRAKGSSQTWDAQEYRRVMDALKAITPATTAV